MKIWCQFIFVALILLVFSWPACQVESDSADIGIITVSPEVLRIGEEAQISVEMEDFQPGVRQDISCGATPFYIDYDFEISIKPSISSSGWIALQDLTWNWETNGVEGIL